LTKNKCCGNCNLVSIQRSGDFVLICCRLTLYPIHPLDKDCIHWQLETEETIQMKKDRFYNADKDKPIFGRNYNVEQGIIPKEILSEEEKSYSAIVDETAKKTGYTAIRIVKYNDELDKCLYNISCPKCKITYTSDYWRKKLNYPRGKIIKQNEKHIICNNCGFEWDIIINLDINNINEYE